MNVKKGNQYPPGVSFVCPGCKLYVMTAADRSKRGVPEGLWVKCPQCKATLFKKDVAEQHNVCPECQHHFYVGAQDRIAHLLDEGSFEEWDANLRSLDPLEFVDRIPYSQRVKDEEKKTGLPDAAVTGKGFIRGRPLVLGITDFAFMAGSMGSVAGEKLTRAVERAMEMRLPLVFVSGSGGGARMQEGILSLMQMAKVSCAIRRFHDSGGLYVGVLTNPTMGGVAASWALQGDITLAEPKAMVGFAGARTIKNTIRLELPHGFQTSEFLMKHGFVDRIVHRKDLRTELARIIDYCEMTG